MKNATNWLAKNLGCILMLLPVVVLVASIGHEILSSAHIYAPAAVIAVFAVIFLVSAVRDLVSRGSRAA